MHLGCTGWAFFAGESGTRLRIGVERKKKIGERSESRGIIWGGERVAEPGDMPLMPRIRPTAIYYVDKSSFHHRCQREPIMSLL